MSNVSSTTPLEKKRKCRSGTPGGGSGGRPRPNGVQVFDIPFFKDFVPTDGTFYSIPNCDKGLRKYRKLKQDSEDAVRITHALHSCKEFMAYTEMPGRKFEHMQVLRSMEGCPIQTMGDDALAH